MSCGWRIATAAAERAPAEVYIALGANLGDRMANLRHAVHALHGLAAELTVSPVYETAPVGFADQPSFLNMVVRMRTHLSPDELLHALKGFEERIGRTPTFRNGPREIDIDILLYDDALLTTTALTIPHPRMEARAFVLQPLLDVWQGDEARRAHWQGLLAGLQDEQRIVQAGRIDDV